MTHGTVAVFLHHWKIAFIGNFIISIVGIILLFESYHDVLEPRIEGYVKSVARAAVNVVALLLGINFNSIILYLYERTIRIGYLHKKDTELVSNPL